MPCLAHAAPVLRVLLMRVFEVASRLFADFRTVPRMMARRRTLRRVLSLMPEKAPSRRLPEDWMQLRKRTLKEARHSLEGGQPLSAIHLISRALLEDPHNAVYHDMLQKAVAQRNLHKAGRHRPDQEFWVGQSAVLRETTQKLEAFAAYAQAITKLMPKSALKTWAPSSPELKDGRRR